MSPRETVTHFEGDDCQPDGHIGDLAAIQAAAWAETTALRGAGCQVDITPAAQPTADGNRVVWRCAIHDAGGRGRDFDSADADARVHAYEILVERWHAGDDPRPLHEYLGMTWQRYGQWLHEPRSWPHQPERCTRCGVRTDRLERGHTGSPCAPCALVELGYEMGVYDDTKGERP